VGKRGLTAMENCKGSGMGTPGLERWRGRGLEDGAMVEGAAALHAGAAAEEAAALGGGRGVGRLLGVRLGGGAACGWEERAAWGGGSMCGGSAEGRRKAKGRRENRMSKRTTTRVKTPSSAPRSMASS
jgi:hypothetical protein